MKLYRLLRDTNTCDSRMGASHPMESKGIFRSAEEAHAKAEGAPPLNKWYKTESSGVLSCEGWTIEPEVLSD